MYLYLYLSNLYLYLYLIYLYVCLYISVSLYLYNLFVSIYISVCICIYIYIENFQKVNAIYVGRKHGKEALTLCKQGILSLLMESLLRLKCVQFWAVSNYQKVADLKLYFAVSFLDDRAPWLTGDLLQFGYGGVVPAFRCTRDLEFALEFHTEMHCGNSCDTYFIA